MGKEKMNQCVVFKPAQKVLWTTFVFPWVMFLA